MWSEEPAREALSGFLLAAGVAFLLLVVLYVMLWIRWALGVSPAPGFEGLAAFALMHGGAASAEVPPIQALFGLGGSVKVGPPATTLVLLPFLALLVGGWAVAQRVRASWLFVAVIAVSYAILVGVVAILGSASFEGGEGVTVKLAADPVSSGLRAFLWAGVGTILGVSAARGPLLPDGTRQVLKGALVAVGVSVALTLILALAISLFGGAPDVPTQGISEGLGQPSEQPTEGPTREPSGDPASGDSTGSGVGGLLAGMGALFALLPAGLGNLWLLAHGLPVGFQNVPDLSSVPLIGEALKDVPLRVSLLGDWPFGGAWRLLVAPIAGLVFGGMVAARSTSARPLQGALVAVPYMVIAVLTAVLAGLDLSLSVAALDVDLAFGVSLAWTVLLLPVAAALGALGGFLGRRGEASVPRPRRTMLITGAASAVVLLLTLPVALAPLSSGSAVPSTAPGHPPITGIDSEPTVPAEPEPTAPKPAPPSEPEPAASVPPDAPPDPAFDALLPTLQQTTTAPIMLPAELPEELKNVAIDSSYGGDEYGILFLAQPTGNVVEDYVHAYDAGTIRSTPDPEEVSPEFFDASREETVELPDGTAATLRYLEPSMEGGNAAPFWEGRFEKEGQTYIVNVPLVDPNGDMARGLLTSMVEVPDSGEQVSAEQRFIFDYYAAVGREDWAATYSMLDAASKLQFTEEEWIRKQQVREAASGAPPVESAIIAEISGEGAGFTATVNLAYEDGTQATLPGIVVYFEDGEFKRHLTDEDLAFLEDF